MIVQFLKQLSDKMGDAGCNDLKLPDAPETRELVSAATKYMTGEDREVRACDGRILTTDFIIVDYLAYKLETENE